MRARSAHILRTRGSIAAVLSLLLIAAGCAAAPAPTPAPATPTPVPSITPGTTPVSQASPEPGRIGTADGRASLALPDGWVALAADDPELEAWFPGDLAGSIRDGQIAIAAVDAAESAPDRPTYVLLAPVEEAGYAAGPARSFVDRAVAGGQTAVISEVALPAGAGRRVRTDGVIDGPAGELPTRQVVYVVPAGASLWVLLVQAVDRDAAVAESIAETIAAGLDLVAEPGTLPDVPDHACSRTVPLADALARSLALDDLGADHAAPGEPVTYALCPPTSGTHYGLTLLARFHGPTEATVPMEWVHNLEHGQVALLYACATDCDDVLPALEGIAAAAPPSPLCERPGVLVVTRYDDLPAPFALVAWGRLRYLPSLDEDEVTAFIAAHADRGPEPQCEAAAELHASAQPSAP